MTAENRANNQILKIQRNLKNQYLIDCMPSKISNYQFKKKIPMLSNLSSMKGVEIWFDKGLFRNCFISKPYVDNRDKIMKL